MKTLAIALVLLLSAPGLKAQLRDATPAEQHVLDKAVAVITRTLDQFNSNDWDKTQDYYSGEIAVNPRPAVPLDIDNNFERQYMVRVNSDRYDRLIKPIVEKISDAMQQNNTALVLSLGKQNKALVSLRVDVYINRQNLDFNLHGKDVFPLHITGTAYGYKVKGGENGNEGNSYWLLFGNWAAARPNQYGMGFSFVYPKKTPYIENIAMVIQGADDRINELLNNVDWQAMNNALTP